MAEATASSAGFDMNHYLDGFLDDEFTMFPGFAPEPHAANSPAPAPAPAFTTTTVTPTFETESKTTCETASKTGGSHDNPEAEADMLSLFGLDGGFDIDTFDFAAITGEILATENLTTEPKSLTIETFIDESFTAFAASVPGTPQQQLSATPLAASKSLDDIVFENAVAYESAMHQTPSFSMHNNAMRPQQMHDDAIQQHQMHNSTMRTPQMLPVTSTTSSPMPMAMPTPQQSPHPTNMPYINTTPHMSSHMSPPFTNAVTQVGAPHLSPPVFHQSFAVQHPQSMPSGQQQYQQQHQQQYQQHTLSAAPQQHRQYPQIGGQEQQMSREVGFHTAHIMSLTQQQQHAQAQRAMIDRQQAMIQRHAAQIQILLQHKGIGLGQVVRSPTQGMPMPNQQYSSTSTQASHGRAHCVASPAPQRRPSQLVPQQRAGNMSGFVRMARHNSGSINQGMAFASPAEATFNHTAIMSSGYSAPKHTTAISNGHAMSRTSSGHSYDSAVGMTPPSPIATPTLSTVYVDNPRSSSFMTSPANAIPQPGQKRKASHATLTPHLMGDIHLSPKKKRGRPAGRKSSTPSPTNKLVTEQDDVVILGLQPCIKTSQMFNDAFERAPSHGFSCPSAYQVDVHTKSPGQAMHDQHAMMATNTADVQQSSNTASSAQNIFTPPIVEAATTQAAMTPRPNQITNTFKTTKNRQSIGDVATAALCGRHKKLYGESGYPKRTPPCTAQCFGVQTGIEGANISAAAHLCDAHLAEYNANGCPTTVRPCGKICQEAAVPLAAPTPKPKARKARKASVGKPTGPSHPARALQQVPIDGHAANDLPRLDQHGNTAAYDQHGNLEWRDNDHNLYSTTAPSLTLESLGEAGFANALMTETENLRATLQAGLNQAVLDRQAADREKGCPEGYATIETMNLQAEVAEKMERLTERRSASHTR